MLDPALAVIVHLEPQTTLSTSTLDLIVGTWAPHLAAPGQSWDGMVCQSNSTG